MKTTILVLYQNIEDIDGMNLGMLMAQEKAATIGLKLDFMLRPTDQQFAGMPFENNVVGKGACIDPSGIVKATDKISLKYNIYCVVFDPKKVSAPQPTNPFMYPLLINDGTIVQIPVNWYSDLTKIPVKTFPEVFTSYFLHELCHAGYYLSGRSGFDITHSQLITDGWNTKSNIDWYLHLLEEMKPYWRFFTSDNQTTMEPYKYFKLNESTGNGHTVRELEPELMKIIDEARGIAGIPFRIGNGKRTVQENASIPGAAKNSAHLRGKAVDLSCKDNKSRMKMLWGLMQFREKLFIEIAGGHIHADTDSSIHEMGSVMWGDDSN